MALSMGSTSAWDAAGAFEFAQSAST